VPIVPACRFALRLLFRRAAQVHRQRKAPPWEEKQGGAKRREKHGRSYQSVP
jgi:hypothetical protein